MRSGLRAFAEPVRLKKKNTKKDDNPPPDENAKWPGAEPQNGKVTAAKGKSPNLEPDGDKVGDRAVAGRKEEKSGGKTLQSKAAGNAFKLTKESVGGPATLLARLKSLRREGADDDVWSLLRSLNPDTADLADPEKWWDFRRSEVRRALSGDHPATAYAIAKAHGPLDDETRSEAEFMAGWVAPSFHEGAAPG